jgi:hypothetical protein
VQALGHGQNTCMSLLLLSATAALWSSGRALAAGVVCGLLFYKPQLGAIIAAALVATMGWRAMMGLAVTGAALLATTLVSLPGMLMEFVHKLPGNVAYMQVERRYLWERHVTLKAFWRLLVQGYETGEMSRITLAAYVVSVAMLGVMVGGMIWTKRKQLTVHKNEESEAALNLCRGVRGMWDEVIAATIVSMPLLMPFYFDYDLLLMSVAAVMVARVHLRGEKIGRPMLGTWIALYGWLMVNPAIAGRTHVNGTVIVLSVLAGMLIRRAMKQASGATAAETVTTVNLRQAA